MSQLHNEAHSSKAHANHVDEAVSGAAALARDQVDRVAETVSSAEQGVRSAIERTADAAGRAQDRAVEAAGRNLRGVRAYVGRNPFTSAGVAFAVGALLAAWVRR